MGSVSSLCGHLPGARSASPYLPEASSVVRRGSQTVCTPFKRGVRAKKIGREDSPLLLSVTPSDGVRGWQREVHWAVQPSVILAACGLASGRTCEVVQWRGGPVEIEQGSGWDCPCGDTAAPSSCSKGGTWWSRSWAPGGTTFCLSLDWLLQVTPSLSTCVVGHLR